MSTDKIETELFKFKPAKNRKNNTHNKRSKSKNKNGSTEGDSKLKTVNPQGKIKKKKPHKWVKPVNQTDGEPKKYDIQQLDDKIETLKAIEEPTKKVRKKLRQLEHLHRKITQITLTETSLALGAEDNDGNGVNNEGVEEMKESSNNDDDGGTLNSDENEDSDGNDEDSQGSKRYVVFVGNLPTDTKESDVRQHLAKVGTIKSIRFPDKKENRKSGFAFVELGDRITYEKTLSMHHTMLKNKRINVMYTNPDGKNLDKKEVMRKNAKLDAMRKAGKLAGSIPEHQRRSFRRKKKRLAEAKALADI